MQQFNEKLNIRWDLSYEMDASGFGKADLSEYDSIIIERQQAKDFLKTIEIEDKKRHQSSKMYPKPEQTSAKKVGSMTCKNKDIDGFYFSSMKLQLPRNLNNLLSSNFKCPDLATSDMINRIYGAFFGLLIGDSIGAYTAFQVSNLDDHIIQALSMNSGGTYNLSPGQVSDDSQMAFSLAYGLIAGEGKYDMDLVCKQYGLWHRSKPSDISALVAIVLNGLRHQKIQQSSTKSDIQGISDKLKKQAMKNVNQQTNIGLIRLLPLAIWSINLPQYEIAEVIRAEMELLNPNPLAIEAAIIWVKALHILFRKGDHEYAYYTISKEIYDSGSEELQNLWQIVEKGQAISGRNNVGRLKTSFTYGFIELNQPNLNFTDTLIEVLRKGGDTDSNAAVVCSLVGAAIGYTQIPSFFRYRILSACVETGKVRPPEYTPNRVVDIVRQLIELAPSSLTFS